VSSYLFIGMEVAGYACLKALIEAGMPPAAVITLDEAFCDRIIAFRSFRDLDNGEIPFYYVEKLNAPTQIELIRHLAPQLIVTAYWSEMLPPDILAIAPLGCIGLHGTKLPKHRGRAPIPWSIIFGLRRGGMTLFQLTTEPDSGAILAQAEYSIEAHDYAATIYDRAAECAASLMADVVPQLLTGRHSPVEYPAYRLDYWKKREPADGFIDWWMTSERIYDLIRALSHPFPGAYAMINGIKITIWRATYDGQSNRLTAGETGAAPNGCVMVGSGCGVVTILEMECDGRPLSAADFFQQFASTPFYT